MPNCVTVIFHWYFGPQVFVTAENGSLFGIIEKKNLIDFDKAKKK